MFVRMFDLQGELTDFSEILYKRVLLLKIVDAEFGSFWSSMVEDL